MKCPECGGDCAETDRFCKNCGAKLPEAELETVKTVPPEALAKGKFYKYAVKAVFIAFTVLALLLFLLPVDRFTGANVYICAAAGNYGEGLDGRWDTSVFIIELFANIFSDVDLVITPCALMVVTAIFGLCFAIAWIIVFAVFKAKKSGRETYVKAELLLPLVYALFAVADAVLICGLKLIYNAYAGPAAIALMVLTAVCFALTVVLYVKRNKFLKKNGAVADALKIK